MHDFSGKTDVQNPPMALPNAGTARRQCTLLLVLHQACFHHCRSVMDEHNPPMVLPNGRVYGEAALTEMSLRTGGRITCPATGFVCDVTELRRAYIS